MKPLVVKAMRVGFARSARCASVGRQHKGTRLRRGRHSLLLEILLFGQLGFQTQAQFTHTINGCGITITGYAGPGGAVVVPDEIDGRRVTAIGAGAFWSCTELESVWIPESVAAIGGWAFGACTRLSSVVLPDSVAELGAGAFTHCIGLREVTLGEGLRRIGDEAFSYSGVASVRFGAGVEHVGKWAFAYCTNLGEVQIPGQLAGIGPSAFEGCTSLGQVRLGRGVIEIGDAAFLRCHSLTNFIVNSCNEAFSSLDGMLFNKDRTTLIQCPSGKAGPCKIPDTVSTIGKLACYSCAGLTSMELGRCLAVIEPWAFGGCTGLTNVVIPATVRTIGDYAFYFCANLETVCFCGNAPGVGCYTHAESVFGETPATVCYLPGTLGWEPTHAGRPTAPWALPYPVILSGCPGFGAKDGAFSFVISWATNTLVVVEASTDPQGPAWIPLATNLLTAGTNCFSEAGFMNYPCRFYRVRSQ